MKKIAALLLTLIFSINIAHSEDHSSEEANIQIESSAALTEMQKNMSLGFHQMTNQLEATENEHFALTGKHLYQNEMIVALVPQVGIKIPILVDLSFYINLRFLFRRQLPAGYAYDTP